MLPSLHRISGPFLQNIEKTIQNEPQPTPKKPIPCLVVLGSGGHTSEMLRLLSSLPANHAYKPRNYVIAETDFMSETKLLNFESEMQNAANSYFTNTKEFNIYRIPRSREVGQSYSSSIYSTLVAFFSCIPILFHTRPQLILVNGPGTCVPICFVSFLFEFFLVAHFLRWKTAASPFRSKTSIVFIESFCRVKTMSLTGKILYYTIADHILVQWKNLKQRYPKAYYFGRLV